MKEGLLWYDSDPQRKLADKVSHAATRYQVKFGRKPTVCYLNATDLNGAGDQINGIRLQAASNIIRHHFWVGVEGDTVLAKAA